MIAWTIYITFAGALGVLLSPRAFSRCLAFLTTVAGFAISLFALFQTPVGYLARFNTIVRVPWVPMLGMNYHLAVDGISLTMVLVTGIVAVSTVLFSWDIEHRQNEFFFWLLLVVAGSYGVFLSADLFLLFVFYELVIVPKYFLIAIFGSTNKEYGAMKLTLYSFFGGALVFIGILAAYVTAGSLDLNQLAQFQFPPQLQLWAFPVLFLGFAVLAGVWPLHTWAPTGHVAAPTAGSMLLAGIVMKLGAYGGLLADLGVLDREVSGDQRFQGSGFSEAEVGVAREVDRLSRDWGLQPYQVSLAWLLSRPAVASVIVGAESVDELLANATAADVQLDAAQLDSLTALAIEGTDRWLLDTRPASDEMTTGAC